ncbi:MAG: MFS transporter [Chloroflexota bacterium]
MLGLAAPTTAPPRLSGGQRLGFLACSVGVGVFSAFNNFTLPLWLTGFTSSYLLLGLLGNTRTFEGAIVSPLAGAWSDRIWLGWLGRRRPFILVGGLASAALLALTPTIGRWPLPLDLGWLPGNASALVTTILTVLLFTVTFNAMDDIHRALVADLTVPDERNGLSALMVGVEMASQVGFLVVGYLWWSESVPDDAFLVAGGLMALAILTTVVVVREPPPSAWLAERVSSGAGAVDDAPVVPGDGIRRYHAALVLGLVMFFYWSGVNAVMPLVSVYVRDILHGTVGQAQLLPGLMLLATMAMAIPVGALGNKLGKRRVMAAGAVALGCAALSGLVITTPGEGVVTFLVGGVGNAAVMVLTVPLLADLVPRHHIGAATGMLAAAGSIAAPIAALAAGTLSDLHGPRAIFALMAGSIVVALCLLPFTRQPAAAAE